jgi:hypothetical protein
MKNEGEYSPVKMIKSYDLKQLPKSVAQFIEDMQEVAKAED